MTMAEQLRAEAPTIQHLGPGQLPAPCSAAMRQARRLQGTIHPSVLLRRQFQLTTTARQMTAAQVPPSIRNHMTQMMTIPMMTMASIRTVVAHPHQPRGHPPPQRLMIMAVSALAPQARVDQAPTRTVVLAPRRQRQRARRLRLPLTTTAATAAVVEVTTKDLREPKVRPGYWLGGN